MNGSDAGERKLDRLLQLIEGEPDAPGILGRLALHEEVLFGKRGNNGLVNKVNILWRGHVWVLCTLSGGVGYLLREFIVRMHL